MAYFLFTNHPPNAVDDVAFAATIWANDSGDALIETDNCFIGKTFKTLDF
jgi:hypothetical protein